MHVEISCRTASRYFLFQEFMIATDMTTSGSVDEKLRWAFKMYDGDGSGRVRLVLRLTSDLKILTGHQFSIKSRLRIK